MARINTISSYNFGLKCASKSHRLYINILLYEGRIVAVKFAAPDFENVILLKQERLSRNLAIAASLSPFYSHAVSAGRREADVVGGWWRRVGRGCGQVVGDECR